MTAGSRLVRIRLLVAEQAARRGGRVGVLDVCMAAVETLPVGGAGVSVTAPGTAGYPVCSTDDVSEQLEELQLTLGEGPCVDASQFGTAVLTPDLRTQEARGRWPMFVPAATDAGALAVFAFPLQMGAISPGVLDLYADVPGDLDADELADAMAFADTATLVLLDTRIEDLDIPGSGTKPSREAIDLGGYRAEIDQATGMLTQQLGVGIEEAFIRLRAHAYAQGLRITAVAGDIVGHRLRLPADAEPKPKPTPNPETDPDTDTDPRDADDDA